MSLRLNSITLSDFRSIRGTVTASLDAPVVLIHGPNGTGKTSILSGIELALAGEIPSLGRVESDYRAHLVHKKAKTAKVALAVSGGVNGSDTTELSIADGAIVGRALLQKSSARFYSERCYLAQSALGRLLEIYQHKDTRQSDSPLTQFVKDLLGLDQLEAIIDGLHASGDVRRLRGPVPRYAEVRGDMQATENQIKAQEVELLTASRELQAGETALASKLDVLEVSLKNLLSNIGELAKQLRIDPEQSRLAQLARFRRDLFAAREEWRLLTVGATAIQRSAAEASANQTRERLDAWRAGAGQKLNSLVAEVTVFFPDLPSPTATNPQLARDAAERAVIKELERCTALLDRDAADANRIAVLEQQAARVKARSLALDQQIAVLSSDSGSMAQALANILPHVHTDDCPVCGRDFKEISPAPLSASLSNRIAALTESAGRLQSLSREKVAANNEGMIVERERGEILSRQISDDTRNQLKTRRARLEEVRPQLVNLNSDVQMGMELISHATLAARNLDDFRSRDTRANTLRENVHSLADEFSVRLDAEPQIEDALNAVELALSEEEQARVARQVARQAALADAVALESLRSRYENLQREILSDRRSLEALAAAKDRADWCISEARNLAHLARDVRTEIVRKVFNDSLNAVWRDLFIRLAPEEQFVPAFALPEGPGSVEAVLETIYRAGGKGGNPRAMLSAGNLNTAALTLFLSLHLSVNIQLPWLVVDDPVQSMDEVHIAQFAALLRTLSKSHGRQIIIAMHERALFDYLTLELSPAFEDDRLITIELGRSSDGQTTLNYNHLIWRPDPAVAA